MKTPIIISISLVAILLALVLGWAVFVKTEPTTPVQPPIVKNGKNANTTPAPSVEPTPTPDNASAPTPSPSSEIDTSDWKVYRNEEFGFELKYPKEWAIDSPAYKGSASKSGKVYHILGMSPYGFEGDWSILISVIPQSIDEVLEDNDYYWNKGWEIKNKEVISINNTPAQKVTWNNEAIVTYFQKPDKSITIEFGGDARKIPTINDILYTFKFIK